MSVFTTIEPELLSEMIGTGYLRFEGAYGINGLVKINDGKLDFLAVRSEDPGKGNFSKFLKDCKRNYSFIRVRNLMNKRFAKYLSRNGFKKRNSTYVWKGNDSHTQ